MTKRTDIRKLTFLALMTAIVVVLQLAGSFIRFGQFSVSLVLVPIVIGVVIAGPYAGAWLGFAFGCAVLLSGDAATFFAISPFGTIVTVLVKGTLAGFAAGLVFRWLSKYNKTLATFAAGAVCPIVNTGIFLIGCRIFFYNAICEWAAGEGKDVVMYLLIFFVGFNFLFELAVNMLLSPVVIRLIDISKKRVR
ncbi:MAG: ECF transporter S component [Clostridia bacterium]|nr:ECF transporter S component [Clostridia bacterium]